MVTSQDLETALAGVRSRDQGTSDAPWLLAAVEAALAIHQPGRYVLLGHLCARHENHRLFSITSTEVVDVSACSRCTAGVLRPCTGCGGYTPFEQCPTRQAIGRGLLHQPAGPVPQVLVVTPDLMLVCPAGVEITGGQWRRGGYEQHMHGRGTTRRECHHPTEPGQPAATLIRRDGTGSPARTSAEFRPPAAWNWFDKLTDQINTAAANADQGVATVIEVPTGGAAILGYATLNRLRPGCDLVTFEVVPPAPLVSRDTP